MVLPPRPVHFQQLSNSPALFHARGFLTETECEAFCRLSDALGYRPLAGSMECTDFGASRCQDLVGQQKLSEEDVEFLRLLRERQAALTGSAETCTAPHVRVTYPSTGDVVLGSVAFPMHLDVYREDAYVTILVYLSTLPPELGGQTLFPMAVRRGWEASATAAAGDLPQRIDLMIWEKDYGLRHLETAGPRVPEPRLNRLAERLATGAAGLAGPDHGVPAASDPHLFWGPEGLGLAVAPRRGDAVCFFTRRLDGSIDPAAWHGVAELSPNAPPRRLSQLWGHLPKQRARRRSCTPETRPARFCREHAWLHAGTAAGVCFQVGTDPGDAGECAAARGLKAPPVQDVKSKPPDRHAQSRSGSGVSCKMWCPGGHGPLRPFAVQAKFPCDICDAEAEGGAEMWGCPASPASGRRCSYDICDGCRRVADE